MDANPGSRSSSPLSSPPASILDDDGRFFPDLTHVPSSPLSSIDRSPSPPPGWAVVTPPPSQDAGEAMPRPRKRRKIEHPVRTTRYLDLTEDTAQSHFDRTDSIKELQKALRNRRKIVVVAGAGISVSAGIPDFRSSNGLFASLKGEHKLKGGSGKQLFDAAVYKDADSTSQFHEMVRKLSNMSQNAKPTSFHHMLARLAVEGRLLRLYTQNVDGLETQMQPLETEVPLPHKGPWPQTVQLHGGLEKMMCQKCREIMDFDAQLFAGSETPACPKCRETDDIRTNDLGRRSHGIGRLRPRIVLYNEANPDDEAIGAVSAADMRTRPDAIVVVGTSMKIPGVRRIVSEMCKIVRGRKDGTSIWINPDPEPTGPQFEDCWDLIVKGDSDQVAALANLQKWDDHTDRVEDMSTEYTDSDLEKIIARQGEVKVNVPPSPLKKGNESAGLAVITPPHSQNGELRKVTPPKPSLNSPIRIKLLVGAKSESAEKEQRSQSVQENITKKAKTPASAGRKLKDVIAKGKLDSKLTTKRPYKRKNISNARSDDPTQSRIQAKVTKQKSSVEVSVLPRKPTSSRKEISRNESSVGNQSSMKAIGDIVERKDALQNVKFPRSYDTLPPPLRANKQQSPTGELLGMHYFGTAERFPPGDHIQSYNIPMFSNDSTPALISSDTSPHASPIPQTPPAINRDSEYGKLESRRETISPNGRVPKDLVRLLN